MPVKVRLVFQQEVDVEVDFKKNELLDAIDHVKAHVNNGEGDFAFELSDRVLCEIHAEFVQEVYD